ncbi:MAG: hypothetical protein U1E28_01920 [Beijerinckiaceae bacterium]
MMNEGNNTPPCGEEAGALRDVRQAEADLKKAEAKMLEAIADEQRAVQRLEAAEAELEHARHHEIEIFVDGEEYKPQRHEMTPNEIIRDFGGKTDVSKFYLMEIAKPENLSFQGKGDTPICLRNKMAFMVMSLAPATVSDPGTPLVGVPAFTAGLEAMGYSPRQLANNPSAIHFEYEVPAGPRAGTMVRIGLIVPPDFPMTVPTGPFVSPRVLPISGGGGSHPNGGIHDWKDFDSAGGEWEYWSRPFNEWGLGRKTVGAYMAHVCKLWATL